MTKPTACAVLLDAFGQELHAEDASRYTISASLADLRHFFTWSEETLGTNAINDITQTDSCAYREYLQERDPPVAPATINRRLAALRRFARLGQRASVHGGPTSSPNSHCGKR